MKTYTDLNEEQSNNLMILVLEAMALKFNAVRENIETHYVEKDLTLDDPQMWYVLREDKIYYQFGISRDDFYFLCNMLADDGLLKKHRFVTQTPFLTDSIWNDEEKIEQLTTDDVFEYNVYTPTGKLIQNFRDAPET